MIKKIVEWCVFEPAYGRVYETADEVLAAFHSNKQDFLCHFNGYSAYSTKREMLELTPARGFELRYGARHERCTMHVEIERG